MAQEKQSNTGKIVLVAIGLGAAAYLLTRPTTTAQPCTPTWVCETPLNGYEKDGCGNRRLNSACNAPTLTTITVTPADPSIPISTNQIFTATAYDQNVNTMSNINISWSLTNNLATISPTSGTTNADGETQTTLTAGSTIGQTRIIASNSSGTITGGSDVTITQALGSITLLPTYTINDTNTYQVVPTCKDNANPPNTMTCPATSSFTWTTTNDPVLSVSTSGLLTPHKAGTATIRASYTTPSGTITSNDLVVTVNSVLSSISLEPPSASIIANGTKVFTATAKDQFSIVKSGVLINWTLSDNTHGTVNPTSGTTDATGTTGTTFTAGNTATTTLVLTAKNTASGLSDTSPITITVVTPVLCRIRIDNPSPNLTAGQTVELTGTCYDQNGNAITPPTQLLWTSTHPEYARVVPKTGTLNKATVTATSLPGSTNITARLDVTCPTQCPTCVTTT